MNLTLLKLAFAAGQSSGAIQAAHRLGLQADKKAQTFEEFLREVSEILEPKKELEPEPQK